MIKITINIQDEEAKTEFESVGQLDKVRIIDVGFETALDEYLEKAKKQILSYDDVKNKVK
jgi:hypothetical protein